jgi:squalene-hopene/tetraprenyl-beta-curcumene cyclase
VNGFSTLAATLLDQHLELAPVIDLASAIERGRDGLLARQRPDGHWLGELEGDSILESEFILLMAFLGRERDDRVRRAANYLIQVQMPQGGWGNYPGGPAEVSVSVKAYFALKIAGHAPDANYMKRAASVIRGLGGAEACNSFTKFYLAMLGQTPYSNCPAVPPEIVLMPRWFYFNIYAMSAWSRTILVPLSVVWAHKPIRQLPVEISVRELFLEAPETLRPPHPPTQARLTWTNVFLRIDSWLKRLERWYLTPFRRWAVRRAVAWMRERYVDSDGLGAIFPPMIYNAIVLRCLGVADDNPEMVWALKQLDDLMIPEGDTIRLQPCVSPVWDTALSLIALADACVSGNAPQIQRSVRWLLEREVRRPGDWSVANSRVEPGGWCFEYRNGFYPDTDDTAMVLIALSRVGHARTAESSPAVGRALNWLLAMQNSDGGWAAFDRDINREILTKVPFADHNAMLDPSCPDITARVLEALGHFGHRPGQPVVDRALQFVERTQCANGPWIGRWGVNFIYGTWQVLVGLKSIGFDMHAPMVRKAVKWLKSVQQTDGAWGESCRSYDDPGWAGRGAPTASQTAWALLGLMAAGEADSTEARAGIDFLISTQGENGAWSEQPFTGTGFPKVFYLKYHMYPVYFPLMAVARMAKISTNHRGTEDTEKTKIRNGPITWNSPEFHPS